MKDSDPEIRANVAAAIIGHGDVQPSRLKALLTDPEPRVRYKTLLALSRELPRQNVASGKENLEVLP